MHSKSDNIEIVFKYKVTEVIEELFQSFASRYQFEIKTWMKDSDFAFVFVHYCITNAINNSKSRWIIYKFSRLGIIKKNQQ